MADDLRTIAERLRKNNVTYDERQIVADFMSSLFNAWDAYDRCGPHTEARLVDFVRLFRRAIERASRER